LHQLFICGIQWLNLHKCGVHPHPDAAIVQSQPGLGVVLGARVLAEFGDNPDRYMSAKARKAYAGTAPITRASGSRQVVLPGRSATGG
jgi:transposase